MWTGLKENTEYSAQITPYHGYVNAEIIVRDPTKGFYDKKLGLWLTVMDKSFGRMFRNSPREIDYQRANEWVEKQLAMLENYGTVIVTKPKHLEENKLTKHR